MKQAIKHFFVLSGMLVGISLAVYQKDGSVADVFRIMLHASFGYAAFGFYRRIGWI